MRFEYLSFEETVVWLSFFYYGHQVTDYKLTRQGWADTIIQIWEDKIDKLNIFDTYQPVESFTNHIQPESNRDTKMIEFAFYYYGKFVVMCVGSDISIEILKTSYETIRRPNYCYSKVLFSQVIKLGEFLAQKYGKKTALLVVENASQWEY